MKKLTVTERIHALIEAVNLALYARDSDYRIMYKGAFGQAGLDRGHAGSDLPDDSLTGWMPKKQLVTYLEAMLHALYMV